MFISPLVKKEEALLWGFLFIRAMYLELHLAGEKKAETGF